MNEMSIRRARQSCARARSVAPGQGQVQPGACEGKRGRGEIVERRRRASPPMIEGKGTMNDEVKGPHVWGGSPPRKIPLSEEAQKWRRIVRWCFSMCIADGVIILINGPHGRVGNALALVLIVSLIAGRYAQRRFLLALRKVERALSSSRRRAFMEWLSRLRH
jgi:hypothetical protein